MRTLGVDMAAIETRLRSLEQASTDRALLIVFVPSGTPTPQQQTKIDQTKQAGRVVILIGMTDADL